MTFLYATDSKFLSSTVSSKSSEATFFIASTISVTKFKYKLNKKKIIVVMIRKSLFKNENICVG